LIGLGAGFLNGVTNSLVSEISLENRSANLSFLGVFYGIGALGTPALFGVLEGLYSFETIFTWIAVLMMFPLIFFISIRFPKSAGVEGFSVKAGVRMVADPLILLFGFILFFQSGIEGIAINWTTTFLDKAKEIEIATALFMLSGFVAALTFVRILLIRLLRVYVPINVMFLSFYLALIGCVLVITTSYAVFVTIGMLLIGAGMACGFPVILGYVGQIYTKLSGTAFSIVITIALVGNVVANYLMGLVSEKFGIGLMPYLLLLCMLVVLGLLYVVNNKYKHALFSSVK
jgi:fucose permease